MPSARNDSHLSRIAEPPHGSKADVGALFSALEGLAGVWGGREFRDAQARHPISLYTLPTWCFASGVFLGKHPSPHWLCMTFNSVCGGLAIRVFPSL